MEFGIFVIPFIFPCGHVTEILVIPPGLMLFSLVCFVEMTAAGLLAFKSIHNQEFCKLEEIGHPAGPLQALVKVF